MQPSSTHKSAEESPEPPTDGRGARLAPVHPLLLAAFPVLALYAHNMAEAPIGAIWRPLGFALAGSAAVWAVSAAILRHVRKAALIASVVAVVFFSYGHIWNLLPSNLRGGLAPVLGVVAAAAILAIVRARGPLKQATSALNLASFVLILPSCWTIAATLLPAATSRAGAPQPAAMSQVDAPRKVSLPKGAAGLPDIYYIVLDAYGRADSLQRIYGYDNTPFIRELERRGFYVAPKSHSNYDQTGLCIASALNMRYLDGLKERVPAGEGADETLRAMIDQSAVAADLRKRGYEYVFIGTGSGQTRVDSADLSLGLAATAPRLSALEKSLVGSSAFDTLPEQRKKDYGQHRSYLLSAFDSLDQVARRPGPKFIFAHILAPHPPFVLGPNGEAVEPRYAFSYADASWLLQMISRADYERGYVGQLQYVNRRTLEAIDAIQRSSRRPPIIIVQGDHGSRMNLDWDRLDKSDLREPFSILNAYCVPQSIRPALYDNITPVNSFRVLLSKEFGENLRRLDDRSAYSTAGDPLKFTDVTALVEREAPGGATGQAGIDSPDLSRDAVHGLSER